MTRPVPRLQHGPHRVYLLGCADGRIKVGRTTNPAQRYADHKYGELAPFTWFHIGPSGDREFAIALEMALCGAFRARGRATNRTGTNEVFTGIDRAFALSAMRDQELIRLARDRADHMRSLRAAEIALNRHTASFGPDVAISAIR